jgi:hypothetical protein
MPPVRNFELGSHRDESEATGRLEGPDQAEAPARRARVHAASSADCCVGVAAEHRTLAVASSCLTGLSLRARRLTLVLLWL